MDFAAIVAWLKSPLGVAVATIVVGWLAKKNPTLAGIMDQLLGVIGITFKSNLKSLSIEPEEPWQSVKYDLADGVVAKWKAGEKDEAAKILDAILLIEPSPPARK